MEIAINGTAHQVSEGISLDRAVAIISGTATGLAASVNGEVVRKTSWPTTRLAPGDQVEVVTAVQGG